MVGAAGRDFLRISRFEAGLERRRRALGILEVDLLFCTGIGVMVFRIIDSSEMLTAGSLSKKGEVLSASARLELMG